MIHNIHTIYIKRLFKFPQVILECLDWRTISNIMMFLTKYLEIDMETICRKDYWYFHRILEYIISNVNIKTMWEKTSNITTA